MIIVYINSLFKIAIKINDNTKIWILVVLPANPQRMKGDKRKREKKKGKRKKEHQKTTPKKVLFESVV